MSLINNQEKLIKMNLPVGFTARPAKLSDAAELSDMFNLVSIKTEGVEDFSIGEVKNDLQGPGFNIEKDSLLICNSEGEIIAYQDMVAPVSMPVRAIVWGQVHPEYMGMGFGSSLLGWGIERAKSVLVRVPEDIRVSIITWNNAKWQPGKEMLESMGLVIKRRYYEMEIVMSSHPPTPVWPVGIKVSTMNYPQEGEAVYRAYDEAFEDHYGHVQEDFYEGFKRFQHIRFNEEGFDPELWFLAKDGDEIAAFSLCRKWNYESKGEGFVSMLGVRRPWRNQGLGLAMLLHSFNEYWKLGQKRVTLGVDGSSLTGALRLYEKAGMRKVKQNNSYELELRPGREISKTE